MSDNQVAIEMYNSGFRAGEELERERIIKLLDELHESKNQSHHITNRSGVCVTCRAIALIKAGE